MTWTDERVELLKKLWADGLSASQIAGELGGKLSQLGPKAMEAATTSPARMAGLPAAVEATVNDLKTTAEQSAAALKDLQASELFVDYQISGVEDGNIVLRVRENPIINRVILEGNKRLKEAGE